MTAACVKDVVKILRLNFYRFCSLEEKLKEKFNIAVRKTNPDNETRVQRPADNVQAANKPKPNTLVQYVSDDEFDVSAVC